MSVPEKLEKLVGEWHGKNCLYLPWLAESPFESEAKAAISFSARGRFLKIEYDWIYEEKTQEGLILIGKENNSDLIKAFWIDSWHLSDKFMVSEGKAKNGGAISIRGFYVVPDNPDWSWRTNIETENDNAFKIVMYNISPEGEETLAVETIYNRQ